MNETQKNGTPHLAATANAPSKRRSRRLERIGDYQQAALAYPDPLAANLGALNSDLMRISYRLMRATDKALALSANPLEDFDTLRPALEACSHVSRQIHRLSQLDCRLRSSRPRKPTTSRSAMPASGPRPTEDLPGEETPG